MTKTMFQSTFPRGERPPALDHLIGASPGFNPRSREGNDVSAQSGFFDRKSFNPRSREGNDLTGVNGSTLQIEFQSTFPRGERPFLILLYQKICSFNPRSREGNDHL